MFYFQAIISWWTVTAYFYNTVYSELTACDCNTAINKAAYASRNNEHVSHMPIVAK